jgi:hypothetical protein
VTRICLTRLISGPFGISALDNGILSSNCAKTVRYLLRGAPNTKRQYECSNITAFPVEDSPGTARHRDQRRFTSVKRENPAAFLAENVQHDSTSAAARRQPK